MSKTICRVAYTAKKILKPILLFFGILGGVFLFAGLAVHFVPENILLAIEFTILIISTVLGVTAFGTIIWGVISDLWRESNRECK